MAFRRSASNVLLVASMAAATLSIPSVVFAATDAADQNGDTIASNSGSNSGEAKLETVVVTAEKRSENLQDVPASIVALSSKQLTQASVFSTLDLSRLVPGFTVDSQKSLFTTIFIRGIGTISNGYSVQPSVATVVDGVVQARAGSSVFANYDDVERVEVLRGPQGTLFGKNSSAGVVSVVTKDPTDDFSADLNIGYGSYDEVKVSGALSGPLTDDGTVLGRISFFTDNRDGYIHNIDDNKNVDGDHQTGGRAKLLFTPVSGTRILVSADYWDDAGNCCAAVVRAVTPYSNYAEQGLLPEFAFPPGFLGQNNSQIDSVGDARTDNKSRGVSVQWDQEIGDYTMTSITAYRAWNAFSDDAMLVNTTPVVDARFFDSIIAQHQTTEELRVASPIGGPVDFVAGVFALADGISDHEDWSLDLRPIIGTPAGSTVLPVNYKNITATQNFAVFGEADYHVTNDITLVAGFRETHETVHFDLAGSLFGGAVPVGANDSALTNNLSWRFVARWQIDPDNMTYVSASRGFKGPAFNGNSTILGDGQKVNPERATSYEVGLKSSFFDDRVRSDLALYYTYLNQFQVQGFTFDKTLDMGIQVLTNAGQLRSQGAELEVDTTPIDNLSLNFNGAYIDAVYSSFPNAPCYQYEQQLGDTACGRGADGIGQNLTGVAAPDAPRFSFNINANYNILLPTLPVDAFVRADYSWKSKVRWDPFNDPTTWAGAYGLLGAGVGVQSKDGHYSFTAFGRNLTNQFYANQLLGLPTPASILSPDYRRMWGITFSYTY